MARRRKKFKVAPPMRSSDESVRQSENNGNIRQNAANQNNSGGGVVVAGRPTAMTTMTTSVAILMRRRSASARPKMPPLPAFSYPDSWIFGPRYGYDGVRRSRCDKHDYRSNPEAGYDTTPSPTLPTSPSNKTTDGDLWPQCVNLHRHVLQHPQLSHDFLEQLQHFGLLPFPRRVSESNQEDEDSTSPRCTDTDDAAEQSTTTTPGSWLRTKTNQQIQRRPRRWTVSPGMNLAFISDMRSFQNMTIKVHPSAPPPNNQTANQTTNRH